MNFLTMGPLCNEKWILTHFVAMLNNIGNETSWKKKFNIFVCFMRIIIAIC